MCQSHTGRLTGLWFLPKPAFGLNTNDDDDICIYSHDIPWRTLPFTFLLLHSVVFFCVCVCVCVCLYVSFFLLPSFIRSSVSWTGLTTSVPLHFGIKVWNREPVANSLCLIYLLIQPVASPLPAVGKTQEQCRHSHASSGNQAGDPNVWVTEVDRRVACRPHDRPRRQMVLVLCYIKQTLYKVKTNMLVHIMPSIKKT